MTGFFEKFNRALGGTARWPAFEFIAERMLSLGRPIFIVETGTMRQENNWAGDGQSTLVWDYLCSRTDGNGVTIDIDAKASSLAYHSCKRMVPRTGDSIRWLHRLNEVEKADLLFLDSWDWTGDGMSELHHAGELAVTWTRLRSGCLVAVDDCHGEYTGKHALVKRFFEMARVQPLMIGYVSVWQKP